MEGAVRCGSRWGRDVVYLPTPRLLGYIKKCITEWLCDDTRVNLDS